MSKDLNKSMLIGRLGQDPEMKYLDSGAAVCSFSIATNDDYTGKDGGKVEQTDWHNIEAWGKLAEICGEYLTKGKQVYIEGQMKTRSWEKDGVKQYRTSIKAINMQMFGGKGDQK